eukprot:TRINITY_DN420_c0_g1_i3.p1 TRINITY_DN420_c0_g1~~TRINITY_DN420_c0_g1_i3.p1  ORF type:complete len:131 (+),score=38.96 TRINITY_DN420_c0_g1_i3:159-551(+)
MCIRDSQRRVRGTTFLRFLLLLLLCLAVSCSGLKLIAEHHEEDNDHGDRGALYRFGVDNVDKKTGKSLGKMSDVTVDVRLPIDTVIDEKYFYAEGMNPDEAFTECKQQADGAHQLLIQCHIPAVIEHTGT